MKPVYAIVIGVLLIGVVACGGGGDDEPPSPSATIASGGAAGQPTGVSGPTSNTGGASTGVASPNGATGSTGATGSAATGASGAPAAGGGGAAVDACALLSEQTIADAMGEGITATRPETQGPTSQCSWDGATVGRRYVAVIRRPAQFAAQVLENSYKNQAGSQPVDVGDEGYAIIGSNQPDYRYLTAAAIEGDLYVQVNVAGPERPDSEALLVITEALRMAVEAAR